MKLGKLFLGVVITAFALFVSAGFGTGSAKAAETEKAEETSVSIKDVTVSGTTQEILIKETETAEKDNKLYVSVYKHKDNIALDDGKGNVCYLKEQKRAEYDYDAKGEKQVVVDISSLSQ